MHTSNYKYSTTTSTYPHYALFEHLEFDCCFIVSGFGDHLTFFQFDVPSPVWVNLPDLELQLLSDGIGSEH